MMAIRKLIYMERMGKQPPVHDDDDDDGRRRGEWRNARANSTGLRVTGLTTRVRIAFYMLCALLRLMCIALTSIFLVVLAL